MKLKYLSIATVLLALGVPASLHAGDRHVEVKVKAEDRDIKLYVYNGDDSACMAEDYTKEISAGETKNIKARGNGTHRCKLGASWKPSPGSHKSKRWCGNPARDGETCTISCSNSDCTDLKLSCQ